MKLKQTPHLAAASMAGLLLLAIAMFVAMIAGTEPHPPPARGPYLAAVAALALVSLWLMLARERAGCWVGCLAALAYLPGVGPHKLWTEAAAVALAPLIVTGSLLVFTSLMVLIREARSDGHGG